MSRIPTCCCVNCSSIGVVPISVNRTGGRKQYLCSFHANHLEGYTYENDHVIGKSNIVPSTFGVEFETSFSTKKARMEFVQNGYVPTSDCTVNAEYKSPIMEGLNSFSKQCKTYDRLIAEGQLAIGDGCGTHFHYGNRNDINEDTIDYIRRFYHSLFIPLCEAMQENESHTIEIFGRYFTYYASTIDKYTDPESHTNFINTQHTYSLEFRLCKYKNATQMMRCARMIKKMGETICTNFIQHFNDEDLHGFSSRKAYRKHKADITAKKLVKIFMEA